MTQSLRKVVILSEFNFVILVCQACMRTSFRFLGLLALSAFWPFVPPSTACGDETGLSPRRPLRGPFVETDQGFMVPYQTRIPGTEVRFEMIPIPGGTFRLQLEDRGGDADDERVSAVNVVIEPFWIGQHEVTWAEYDEFYALREVFRKLANTRTREVTPVNEVDAVAAPSTLYDEIPRYPSAPKIEWPSHPATSMTQYGAKQYTKWLSKLTGDFYRLPSSAEWEYACRAGSTRDYCFGDDPDKLREYAWYADNSNEDTHPVGLKLPNRWGLYDMHGNASEWVLDEYSHSLESLRRPDGGSLFVQWPERLHPRTVRGGHWDSSADSCRNDSRVGSSKDWHQEEPLIPHSPHWLAGDHDRLVGFRLARSLRDPDRNAKAMLWDADVEELKDAVKSFRKSRHTLMGIVDPGLPDVVEKLRQDQNAR